MPDITSQHGTSEEYDEVVNLLNDYLHDNRNLNEELKYLKDFIRWKGLDDEYTYFKNNSHLDDDYNLPFPP